MSSYRHAFSREEFEEDRHKRVVAQLESAGLCLTGLNEQYFQDLQPQLQHM